VNARLRRQLALLDVAGMAALVPWFIWQLQFAWPSSWLIFPVWLTASFLLHRDTPKTLGWRGDNLRSATRRAAPYFVFAAGLLLAFGFVRDAPTTLPAGFWSFDRLWRYFAFCLLQQVALNSFLMNRLLSLTQRQGLAALCAGTIFAAAHWPNPVLVPTTLLGGALMAWLFARERNILPLTVGQSVIGSLVWWAFPVEWHQGLRVGPGYYRQF
jgi:hypothetical protein